MKNIPEIIPDDGKPFMYGIQGPDGKAHFGDDCVSEGTSELQDVVFFLNDEKENGPYKVVELYLRPVIAPVPAGVQGDAARLELRLKVCLLDGHDPFVFYVDGMMTARVLSGIDDELTANKDELFKDGQGDYEFTATHFDGQYGFEGRCELAPGWEFEQIGFAPLVAAGTDGGES